MPKRTMHAALRTIESLAARLAVLLILSATAAVAAIARLVRPLPPHANAIDAPPTPLRIMLVGTFYNDAWFDAHVEPLLACDAVEHVTVVTDNALRSRNGVEYAIPPRWLRRVVGRTIARALWVFSASRTNRCDLLVGYHIMPNALICLVVSRMLGRRCAYQMTGGPVQLIGGGVGSENTLLRRQRKAGRTRERLMQHLARQFDLVIVRGGKGLDYMRTLGMESKTTIIPAGVDTKRFARRSGDAADFELITVGRLAEVKRYDRLLRIVAAIARNRPDVGCAFVGDGPQRAALETLAHDLGIARNVRFLGRRDDVATLLQRAKLFILTSETEGQSIAMMEAMAAGLPVAAPDVGELTDLLRADETGIVIDPALPESAADQIDALLNDKDRMRRMAAAGRAAVIEFAETQAVACKWQAALTKLTSSPRFALKTTSDASRITTDGEKLIAGSARGGKI
ncbi:MAG: glycosyltransferase [Phycisphaerales bacterium]|nr:glycosyltransferase [Phycisphaerales bacterium]MCB9856507.1 glycosyltransferase [Phycisphaerales bacterium]MCB9863988.1 glycosyltransferase [Phycisphaerales bacterium]